MLKIGSIIVQRVYCCSRVIKDWLCMLIVAEIEVIGETCKSSVAGERLHCAIFLELRFVLAKPSDQMAIQSVKFRGV